MKHVWVVEVMWRWNDTYSAVHIASTRKIARKMAKDARNDGYCSVRVKKRVLWESY